MRTSSIQSMLMFGLICLLFVLLGVTGFQFAYMFYFDRIDRERKKHVHGLEQGAQRLRARLDRAEARIAEQDALLEKHYSALELEDEAWADVIEDS